jgi:hypothetical protein
MTQHMYPIVNRDEVAGFCETHLTERVMSITRIGERADPNWRIVYFGFDKWQDGTKFVGPLAKMLKEKHADRRDKYCELRKAKRLQHNKFEVKVWCLDRLQVLRLMAHVHEEHRIWFEDVDDAHTQLFLNGTKVIRMAPSDKAWLTEQFYREPYMPHSMARRFLIELVMGNAAPAVA